jgi:SHS2 domain-containing protein
MRAIFLGGSDIKEAFEQVAVCMFGYMTDLKTVDFTETREIEAAGK